MRIKVREYPHKESLTTEEIQREVVDLLSYPHCETYREELNFVLDSFANYISSADILGGCNNFYDTYQDTIKGTIKVIKNCVKAYLHGQIYSSFNKFNLRWNALWKDDKKPETRIFVLKPNSIYYKLRKSKYENLKRCDFFHVPFNIRGIIGNNRFSIAGYPCLYLGGSVYTCWEELRRPQMSEIYATAFKVVKPIRLLDLRITQDIDTTAKESDYYRLLPYILASSIRTHSENDSFKPEYIIPQLLLHSVVKNKKYYEYDGIIFTSTRRNMQFDKKSLDLYDNIAIPVMSNRYKSYCKKLASFFTESQPIYLEHELLQGNLLLNQNDVGNQLYENTIFHSIEKILQGKDFLDIL